MKPSLTIAAPLIAAAGWFSVPPADAQVTPPFEIRRAIPVQSPPVARAIPVEPTPQATPPQPVVRALPVPATEIPPPSSAPAPGDGAPPETRESPEREQLNYANGLFSRKLYDLAIPEYEKFLGLYPSSPNRPAALFYLGEAYRALNRTTPARTSFQSVIKDFPDDEMVGPASYALAEIFFNEKDYSSSLPLFHRAAAKVKASSLALSARYFEARCLEALERKDEARDIYLQVIDAADPNPFRDDSRMAAGSIFLASGRKND